MIVVDASALIEVLLNTPSAPAVAARMFEPGETPSAPHLIDLEVAQVFRRYSNARQIDDARAGQAMKDFADLHIERYPHEPFLGRIWELRHNFTVYDATYLTLAEALDAPLLTRDAALAKAGNAKVIVV